MQKAEYNLGLYEPWDYTHICQLPPKAGLSSGWRKRFRNSPYIAEVAAGRVWKPNRLRKPVDFDVATGLPQAAFAI